MSDYTPITDFSVKDALSTGNPSKLIKGSEFDAEFAAIQTAITSKFDSTDLSDQSAAEAGSSNTVLMTPLRVQNWADANGGLVGDLQALADPDADGILFWDDSAGAVAFLTVSTGLTLSGTSLTTNDSAIVHDSLSGFVSDEHVAHSGVSITAGSGLTGGGTIAATRTINVGEGVGIDVAADAVALDISDLTAISSGLTGTDGFLIDDGGTMKRMSVNASHLPSRNVSSSGNFASTDVGEIVYWTGTSGTLTMPEALRYVGSRSASSE